MPEITNYEKRDNYRIQNHRLNKAMEYEFYLEAILIEYAIIEDRVTAFLRYTGDFNPDKQNTINKKLSKLETIMRDKKAIVIRYLNDEIINSIHEWKNSRNAIVHALLNQKLTSDELKEFAEKGSAISKMLSSKSTLYKKYLNRRGLLVNE